MTHTFKVGDFVRKVGGRYGGPGQIVGDTMALDDDGYKLWNVAMRVEGGEGRFVHVFPSSALKPDPNGAKAAASLRSERDRLRKDNGRLRGKVAALELHIDQRRTMSGVSNIDVDALVDDLMKAVSTSIKSHGEIARSYLDDVVHQHFMRGRK